MSSTSETILSNQAYSGTGTKSVTGEQYKADGYYSKTDGYHTVQYSVAGFAGTVKMQATLAVSPVEADWFTVPTTEYTVVESTTSTTIKNFIGNYVWVRATVSWTQGSINSITLNH